MSPAAHAGCQAAAVAGRHAARAAPERPAVDGRRGQGRRRASRCCRARWRGCSPAAAIACSRSTPIRCPGMAHSLGRRRARRAAAHAGAPRSPRRARGGCRPGVGPVTAVRRYTTPAPDGVRLMQLGKAGKDGLNAGQGVGQRVPADRAADARGAVAVRLGDRRRPAPPGPRQPARRLLALRAPVRRRRRADEPVGDDRPPRRAHRPRAAGRGRHLRREQDRAAPRSAGASSACSASPSTSRSPPIRRCATPSAGAWRCSTRHRTRRSCSAVRAAGGHHRAAKGWSA